MPHNKSVWGLESWNFSKTLFLTEGLFDAARMTYMGYSAVAVFSNNPVNHRSWLKVVKANRPVVVLCDNDSAGTKLAKYGSTSYTITSAKDVGDASADELEYVVKKLHRSFTSQSIYVILLLMKRRYLCGFF